MQQSPRQEIELKIVSKLTIERKETAMLTHISCQANSKIDIFESNFTKNLKSWLKR
jgi:hypothetical protein